MTENIDSGFTSETDDSQQIFRKLLTAMAHPGAILDTDLEIDILRRVSGIYKDIPGGQILGPTYD